MESRFVAVIGDKINIMDLYFYRYHRKVPTRPFHFSIVSSLHVKLLLYFAITPETMVYTLAINSWRLDWWRRISFLLSFANITVLRGVLKTSVLEESW